MPKKTSQTEPLFDPDGPDGEAISVPTVEEAKVKFRSPLAQQIFEQLEQLDPAPFRSVLADILESFKGTRWKGVDPDKRVKAGKELAQLIGFAQPSLVINNQTLHVERMNDAELLSELGRARAQLAAVMQGDAVVIGTDLASDAGVMVERGPGGLGDSSGDRGYIKGPLSADTTQKIEDATVIDVPRPAAPDQSAGREAAELPREATPPPGSMAARIAELRAAGKLSPAPLVRQDAKPATAKPTRPAKPPAKGTSARNSKAPAAGAPRPRGRKSGDAK